MLPTIRWGGCGRSGRLIQRPLGQRKVCYLSTLATQRLAVFVVLLPLLFVALGPFGRVFARNALALLVFDCSEMAIARFCPIDPVVTAAPPLEERQALPDGFCGAPQTT